MKIFIRKAAACAAGLLLFLPMLLPTGADAASRLEVLVTTFPIYQITRNVAAGRKALNIVLMLPSRMGCPHDYVLTPQDMGRLARTDLLIINGLGMEGFLDRAIESAKAGMRVADSSAGIGGILHYEDAHNHAQEGHGHDQDSLNPHLFASPGLAAAVALNIAGELSKIDPEGASIYYTNADLYAKSMNLLAGDFAELGRRLKNNRIVTQHGVFDYLARDMGLEIIAAVLSLEGQEPSAAGMLETVRLIRELKVGAVFTEPQYPSRISQTIAREAGIPFAELDPAATGPDDAPLDHYETVMRKNLSVLEETLGTR
ncbi:MAG: metal ABC transporter substrate-binding protein [Thermovirgaceae bacterium]|nr:metal ABC transporter substrate-binding protein [Thermovirgaceae bacterium]